MDTFTMMIRSGTSSSSSTMFVEAINNLHSSSSRSIPISKFNPYPTTICCSSRNSHAYIPKLEPFSRTKLDRVLKDPSLIKKSENELADYCSTLEGDNSYSCWQAYFELKDLENEAPKGEVEKVIIQAGGVKSLIGCLHGISAIHKGKKDSITESSKKLNAQKPGENPCPVPDGLPKSAEEMEEEEKGRMPDSPFTRLLRNKGSFPAWYSPAPDHETD